MDGYGMRVLIVDDNEESRHLLACLLEHEGYNLHVTADGLHALEEMNKRHFDAVIFGYRAPGTDGGEFLLSSQATWPDTPVIMLSDGADDLEHHMVELGAFAWVRKPYEPHLLLSLLLSAVRQPMRDRRERLAVRMAE